MFEKHIKPFPNNFYAFCLYAFGDNGAYISFYDMYFENMVDKANLMYKEVNKESIKLLKYKEMERKK